MIDLKILKDRDFRSFVMFIIPFFLNVYEIEIMDLNGKKKCEVEMKQT